jgi:hypothetical protein
MAFQIANQTSTSLLRPIPAPAPYSRPGDWLTITDTPGEVQFLVSDVANPLVALQTSFTRGATGNIFIDWGDGTTDTITATGNTNTNHTYATGGTPSSLGYNMWKIRVFGDAGTVITNTRPVANTSGLISSNQPSGILEAIYGDGTQTIGFTTLFGGITFSYLDFVKLPASIPGSFVGNSCFSGCISLRKVICPTTAGATQIASMFANCFNLIDVTFFEELPACTTFNAAFSNCFSLTSLDLSNVSIPEVTVMQSAFSACLSLNTIVLPLMPKVTNFLSMFTGCRSLLSLEWTNWPTVSTALNFNQVFQNCSSLEYIKFPAAGPIGDISMLQTFISCANLKNIVIPPTYTTITTMDQTFNGCGSLASCILPPSLPSLLNLTSCFLNCLTLQEITLPTTVGASINLTTTFQGCLELGEVNVPSSYNITTLGSTFNGCINLITVNLPNNSQDSITSMVNTFLNCTNLNNVTLPTSLNGVTLMTNTFQNCSNLLSIVFPASMNNVTSMANFCNGCSSLSSVTLPTSMTSLTLLNNSFTSCRTLRSLVFPATTGNVTTYAGAFNGCSTLSSVTFPSSPQSTALTSLGFIFNNNGNLSTLTNTNLLGDPATGPANTTYVDAGNFGFTSALPPLEFFCKFSRFAAQGAPVTKSTLPSLRLRNDGPGQYGGASPQIDVSYTNLSQAALVDLFNDLPTVTAKTIRIIQATGSAALTPAEKEIATGKGWTIQQ